MADDASSRASGWRAREVDAVRGQSGEVVVGEDVLEPRELVGDLLDLRELGSVLADDPDRFGVREEVADVAGGVVRVDGDPDGADLREREVDERPVEAVLGEDRERVALADAAGEQPVRIGAHELVRIAPGHLAPAAPSSSSTR